MLDILDILAIISNQLYIRSITGHRLPLKIGLESNLQTVYWMASQVCEGFHVKVWRSRCQMKFRTCFPKKKPLLDPLVYRILLSFASLIYICIRLCSHLTPRQTYSFIVQSYICQQNLRILIRSHSACWNGANPLCIWIVNTQFCCRFCFVWLRYPLIFTNQFCVKLFEITLFIALLAEARLFLVIVSNV